MFWVLICTVHLPVCSCHVAYAFQSEFTLYSCLNVKVLLARSMSEIWSLSDCNSTRTHNNLVGKRKLKDLAKLTKWLSYVLSTYLYSAFAFVCSSDVTYTFQSKSILNIKELLPRRRRQICKLSDCHWTRTQKHLVRIWTLNNLAKLTKFLSCALSTYLYVAFDFMFLSCHVRVSEWIQTL